MSRLLVVLGLALASAFASPAAAAPTVTVTSSRLVLGEQIYFDVGKATIKPSSRPLLDAVAATLHREKKIHLVEIGVHTDARGNDRYNLELSQKRAEAIYKYLVAKGVASGRLRAKGYGETRPIDKGSDAKAWARNRRTELVILQTT